MPTPPPSPGAPKETPSPPSNVSRAQAVLHSAISRPEGERLAYLAQACGTDAAFHDEVLRLLKAHDAAGGFLQESLPVSPEIVHELARLKPEEAGEWIGPYRLLQQIGEGGFGVVWMAEQEQPVRRRVALKIIKIGMDTKEVIARFEQERQALAMMDHPNIARVIDAGATQFGRPFFVMELVRGVKITEYCDEHGLSTEERTELFIHVCHAVQHAHQKGIIHRDLKPSNILVTVNDNDAVPKVIDFGVAKATQGRLSDQTLFTQFEQMIGTPIYMSPEQAEMTSLDIDTRSDIYSLGVLLYELLTGHTPIDTATMSHAGRDEIRRMIREVDPPRPSLRLKTLTGEELTTMARVRRTEPAKLPGTLRGDIDWIVMKCIEKDRKRRYDTANALAMDLQRHLRNEVVTARPPTAGYLFGKLVRRNKLVFAAGAAIAASLIAGTAVSAWQAVRAEREYKRANATLDALRATAPAFAAQATALTVQERFEEALEKLNYAAQLQPQSPEHWLAIGDLLQCQLRFRAAAAAYRTAEKTGKADDRARHNAELSDRLEAVSVAAGGRLPRAELANLFESMTNERRSSAELMPIARLLQREGSIALDYWRQRLRSLPISPDRPLESRLSVRPDGLLELDLSGTEISQLQALAGMPLAKLTLSGCRAVTSISPLRGLPLVDLNLDSTEVADLTPLREMHLESLSLANIPATDLSALAALPLRSLDCSNLSASDFGVLARKPLETLILSGARVRDASFLEGLPLRKLSLAGANEVRGLKSLTSLRLLDTLILPHNFYEFPVDDLEAVRAIMDLPAVQRVSASRADSLRLSGVGTRQSFMEEWATDLRWLVKLRKTGAEPILLRLPDRTWEVDLRSQPLLDLSSLQGAPIGRLVLSSVRVSDLRPLAGMQLRVLDLCRTEVNDLSPIRGMPLRRLYLWRVKTHDFSVLSTLPDLELLDLSETEFRDLSIITSRKLRELRIGSSRITDLAPLAGWPLERLHADSIAVNSIEPLLSCPTLKWVIPPQSARDIVRLKALPDLQKISFRWREGSEPIDTAPQFWKDYKP